MSEIEIGKKYFSLRPNVYYKDHTLLFDIYSKLVHFPVSPFLLLGRPHLVAKVLFLPDLVAQTADLPHVASSQPFIPFQL